MSVTVSCRSTKGASKARRDQINVEIRSMRALLPLPQEEVDRLSYLHSMSLICAFLRKTLLLQGKASTSRKPLQNRQANSRLYRCKPLLTSSPQLTALCW